MEYLCCRRFCTTGADDPVSGDYGVASVQCSTLNGQVPVSDTINNIEKASPTLTDFGKIIIISVAFLGWFFGGMHMAITSVAMGSAAESLLIQTGVAVTTKDDIDRAKHILAEFDNDRDGLLNKDEAEQFSGALGRFVFKDLSEPELVLWAARNRLEAVGSKWYGFYVGAFLFGAALGGLVFGRIGDRYGRVKGMAASVLCYSVMSLAGYFVQTPEQLWIVRFVVCMGVGGVWPNGVSLMSEAWEGVSRPLLAGVIGTAANVGIFLTNVVARNIDITVESWRWVMLMGAGPIVLGLIVLAIVPESPRWLAEQRREREDRSESADETQSPPPVLTWEVFKTPLLGVTLVGILFATVPLLGGWGSANWAIKWADQVGQETNNPSLKADLGIARSLPSIVGSFLGGLIAISLGRRAAYFITSLIALGCAQYLFWFLTPDQTAFLVWFGVLGFFSGVFFGWLPLFLPELFVTRVRSTGAGVCFNFGRILTAVTVFATAMLINYFENDYSVIGRITSLVFLLGAIGICLLPGGVDGEIKD